MGQLIDKKQAIKITGVSENTWRKSSLRDKDSFFKKANYKLLSVSKRGRETLFEVEFMGEELIEVKNFLISFGFGPGTNFKALINCIIYWNLEDNDKTLKSLSEKVGVSEATVSNWRKKLIESNIIKVNEKGIRGKREDVNSPIIKCNETEWNNFISFMNNIDSVDIEAWEKRQAYKVQTGYEYRCFDETRANGFYNKFFSLLEIAAAQLEK